MISCYYYNMIEKHTWRCLKKLLEWLWQTKTIKMTIKYWKCLDILLKKCNTFSLINNKRTIKNKSWHAKKLLSYLGPTKWSCGYVHTVHVAHEEATPDVDLAKTRLYKLFYTITIRRKWRSFNLTAYSIRWLCRTRCPYYLLKCIPPGHKHAS